MRRIKRQLERCGGLTALVAGLSLWVVCEASARQIQAGELVDRLVVVFQSTTVPSDAEATIRAAGGRVVAELREIGVLIAEAADGDGMRLRQQLLAEPAVLDVGSDWVVSTDPQDHWSHPLPTFSPALPADFFYTSSPQQWPAKRIGAAGGGVPVPPGDATTGAWDVTFGHGVRIAIIDTGINPIHPDLANQVVFARAISHPTPFLGDVNCEVPDASNPSVDSPIDQVGHGTWTASLAAGALGGGLLIGVAPEAQVLNIKMLRRVPRAV